MPSRIKRAKDKGLIKDCPSFVSGGVQYEVITGSTAYGCSVDTSDEDIYGFCMPPKEMVFPHITGNINGFGKKPQNFEQFQKHHVEDQEARKEYDFSIYSIVKFFQLTMQCNPNMVDTLFVPQRCIVHSTIIGDMVRENRKLFLSKKAWHTFKGYAYQQMKKMCNKKPQGKRKAVVEKYGHDVKFQSHLIRLMLEVEQILAEGDLDLERNSQLLLSIRRGEWSVDRSTKWFTEKERSMESLYNDSKLPYEPREVELRELLMKCLEEYYGSLDKLVIRQSDSRKMALEIQEVIKRYV